MQIQEILHNIFYDGKDKVVSSGQIAMTQVAGEPIHYACSVY